MNKLRRLNFDDLFLLRLLLDGDTVTAVAGRLGLTQPAVTQRLRKIQQVFGMPLTERSGRRVRLTGEGRALCTRASGALALMGELVPGPVAQTIDLGTRPEVGTSWLWPALCAMRKRHPHLVFHLHFGSGDEILRMLETGALDAVLTSAPHVAGGLGVLEVAREDYVFVAAPPVARRVRAVEDLQHEVLVEHDRSLPFTRYVEAGARARLRYREVWFLGSSRLMTEALVAGLGVGIVPRYLARPALARRRLRTVLPGIRIESDRFRLVYRPDRSLEAPLGALAAAMKSLGLR